MFKTVLSVSVAACALALAQPAFATDYCVAPNDTCGGTKLQDFQAALDAAAVDSLPDRIFLGAHTYTAPAQGFIYDPMNGGPVEIVGAGRNATIINGTSGAIRTLAIFGGPKTTVRTMRIIMPPNAAAGAQGLRTDGTVRDVSVVDDVSEPFEVRTGVVLLDDAVLEDSFVGMKHDQPTRGVSAEDGGTIRKSGVNAAVGVDTGGVTIERTYINARGAGVSVENGIVAIRSTVISTTTAGSVGISGEGISHDAYVDVDGVTISGPGDPQSGTGISADNAYSPTASLDMVVRNSIIRGYPSPLWLGATGSGHVHVDASYSDYESSAKHVGGNATLSETNVSYVGETGFNEESDYTPSPGSPLIDAGDPATAQGLDLLGNPLVTDGDGDGVARRDIGARERPAVPLQPVTDSGGDVPSQPAAGGEQPLAPAAVITPVADTLAPAVTGFQLSRKVFAVGRARTAIAARSALGTRFSYVLSENAKVVIEIRRVGAKRAAGRLTRTAKSGRNTLRFSGRIGAKALRPGRYRAVVTATDAAGNRSAPKSIRFRVTRA